MNAELATSPRHSRALIMASVATALRNSDGNSTNIESVIAQANIPIDEVAALFGGHRDLMLAMVAELSETMCAALLSKSATMDVRKRLLDFGQRVTDIYTKSHLRALHRIAITESSRHTGLGRDFYQAGPGRLTRCLANFLQIAQREGAISAADPHLLASHFLSALRADLDVGVDGAYVRNVVDVFFDGITGGRSSCRT